MPERSPRTYGGLPFALQRVVQSQLIPGFLAHHYQRFPYSVPCTGKELASCFGWSDFMNLVSQIPAKDVLVVKNGVLDERLLPRSAQETNLLLGAGYSVVLRHAEKFDPTLAELARTFDHELNGDVVIQLYATPEGFFSFGWHYDAEEVFIIQTEGEKKYFIRENTVNPRPTLAAMPSDMQFEKEKSPTMGSTLIAGDFLYIPGGWWHVALAEKNALSISIGISPRASALRQAG